MNQAALLVEHSTSANLGDIISLTKPRLGALVLATTAGGFWIAPGVIEPVRFFVTLTATALLIGGANALNCYYEREIDMFMRRTSIRPLPQQRLDPRIALFVGISLAVISLPLLWLAAGFITALLGATAFGSYVFAYTPLKTRTSLATIVGAIPGALPPLMGWVAHTGEIALPGLVLFAVLFVWQLPHFLSIALFRQDEYERAGIKVLPSVVGQRATIHQIIRSTATLFPITLLVGLLGMAGNFYILTATFLGVAFLVSAIRGLTADHIQVWARKNFFFSLVHLTLLFVVMMLDAQA